MYGPASGLEALQEQPEANESSARALEAASDPAG